MKMQQFGVVEDEDFEIWQTLYWQTFRCIDRKALYIIFLLSNEI